MNLIRRKFRTSKEENQKMHHIVFWKLWINYLQEPYRTLYNNRNTAFETMNTAKRIVVIDDDVDHLEVSKLILERGGYEVLTLDDCNELVNRIQALAALAGADDWLSKPFNLDDTVDKTRKFF